MLLTRLKKGGASSSLLYNKLEMEVSNMIPKFRAWSNKTAVLAEVINIDFREKKLKVNHWEYGDSIYLPLGEVDLMQSTGLKGYMDDSYDDSEEKDVFKGDIIDI
ncbi:hypothetical protein P7D59_21155, partial [Enterococcus avium]|uniref:YopX family protein n=1 Tax=Enterococcus avium TaxID=33945 RepID=UPI00288ECB0E|nr:hypothetical protein [Enterococcus avium]